MSVLWWTNRNFLARPLGQQSQDFVGAQEEHTTFVDIFCLLFGPRWRYKIPATSPPSKQSPPTHTHIINSRRKYRGEDSTRSILVESAFLSYIFVYTQTKYIYMYHAVLPLATCQIYKQSVMATAVGEIISCTGHSWWLSEIQSPKNLPGSTWPRVAMA